MWGASRESDSRHDGAIGVSMPDPRRDNRFVVFKTTDFSYHGHPVPLLAPEGRARRSIAAYFYTKGYRDARECLHPMCHAGDWRRCTCKWHNTLWHDSPCLACKHHHLCKRNSATARVASGCGCVASLAWGIRAIRARCTMRSLVSTASTLVTDACYGRQYSHCTFVVPNARPALPKA